MSVWQRLYAVFESAAIESIAWRSALRPSPKFGSTHSGQPGDGEHDRHGSSSDCVLPDMLLTKRHLPVFSARLSPHGHKLRPKDLSSRQDASTGLASRVELPAKNLGLHSADYPPPTTNILRSEHVVSASSHEPNHPHIAKLLRSRPEYGTLIESLPARETYVGNEILHGGLDSAFVIIKKGRDQDISQQFPAGRVAQKCTTVRRQIRAFSTTQKYSQNEGNILLNTNEPLPISPPPLQGTTIREHLRIWERQQKIEAAHSPVPIIDAFITPGTTRNLISQSGEDDSLKLIDRDENHLEEEFFVGGETVETLSEKPYKDAFLRKGDVVELRSGDEAILAVFIRRLDTQSQFYTMTGEWVHRRDGDVSFVVHQMISQGKLDPILSYLPDKPVADSRLDRLQAMDVSAPREAAAKILAELNSFHRAATEMIRQNGNKLNEAFEIMAHPTKSSYATLEEITMRVLQLDNSSELTSPALWAVHRVITQTHRFQVDPYQKRKLPRIYMISKAFDEDIKRIRTWVRDYQEQVIADATGVETELVDRDAINPLPNFIEKARAQIEKSRKRRAITKQGCIGPLKPDARGSSILDYTFTRNEKKIVQFLLLWVSSYIGRKDANVLTIGPTILRAVGMYDGYGFAPSTGFLFLQELEAVPPWAQRETYNPLLPLYEYHGVLSKLGGQAHQEAQILDSSSDSMKSFRKDWGEMRVFCIDRAGTNEIDDGVSVEEIHGDSSASWVHIHVANPSAFIAPNSNTGRLAEGIIASLYFPQKQYSMLPPTLSAKHFSLGKNRPCITFSAKVTNDGEIIETEVSHGILRNVKYITPEQVRIELDSGNTDSPNRFNKVVVGQPEQNLVLGSISNPALAKAEPDPSEVSEPLHPSDLDLLRKLYKIGEAKYRRRIQAGALVNDHRTSFEVSAILPGDHSLYNPTVWKRTEGFNYDPFISLTANIANPCQPSRPSYESSNLVENLMILAGEVAASWCTRRNIPVVYRGILPNPEPSEPPEMYKEKYVDPAMAERGSVPLPTILHYMNLVGVSVVSPVPLKHISMGVPAYCKVTSPLRRYGDLLTHWQIEATIRRESEIGSPLVGSADQRYLPFSFSEIQALAPRIGHQEKLITQVTNLTTAHWAIQLLFRAFYFNEAPLPKTFEVCISVENLQVYGQFKSSLHLGWPVELGVICTVTENEATRKEGRVMLGDVWEARISEINCHDRRVILEPIRLVWREAK